MKPIELPRTPGQDFAGVVVHGDRDWIGREVWGTGGDLGFTRDGSHAEFLVIPKRAARAKPANLSMVEAATVGRTYVTAYFGLIEKAQLKAGETVLVTGAGGGVGSSVVKIAKNKGARVIGVDRRPQSSERIRNLGLDLALSSETDNILARTREFTGGKGVDVVFDCVGGPAFEMALSSLGAGGRQINITAVGERRVSFDLLDFYRRGITLMGVNTITLDSVASGEMLERLRPTFEQGRLTPPEIARVCSLYDAVVAYREVDLGVARGKIVFAFTINTA
jgi:NADPH:quinone reductase